MKPTAEDMKFLDLIVWFLLFGCFMFDYFIFSEETIVRDSIERHLMISSSMGRQYVIIENDI